MAILALECSTSAAKALVCDETGAVLSLAEEALDPSCCTVTTQSPQAVLHQVLSCGRAAAERAHTRIEAVSLCGIWHSLLLLDAADQPLLPIWTWANTEAGPTVAAVRADENKTRAFYSRTGCMPHSMYGLWQWMHIKKTQPGLAAAARRLSSQHEQVLFTLTGRHVLPRVTASGSGFLNLLTGEWDADVLRLAGIDAGMLPQLMELDETLPLVPEAAAALGLPAGLPVCAGGADGALSQIGAGAMNPGCMTFSLGTSGALRIVTPEPLLPARPATWCYWLVRGTRLAGAATSGAGSCVSWLTRTVLDGRFTFEELEQAAAGAMDDRAPIFLPFHFGERCPGWQDDRRGGYVDLAGDHGPGALYYALLEGVLMNLYHCYRILTELSGLPEKIVLTGGIVNSPLWMQMAADLFGRPLYVCPVQHASTLGAAAAALVATGQLGSLAGFPVPPGPVILPNGDKRAFYDRRFALYLDRYQREAPR